MHGRFKSAYVPVGLSRVSVARGVSSVEIAEALAALERRALAIQLKYFRIPPEERGRVFYALEMVGEMGELLNDCKKFIRTKCAHRRDEQLRRRIPEEAADTLVGLMLLKLAAGDRRKAAPQCPEEAPPHNDVDWLHQRLSKLALQAARLYAAEARRPRSFNLTAYEAVVTSLLEVAAFFRFSLVRATQRKLTAIIGKVKAGYYD